MVANRNRGSSTTPNDPNAVRTILPTPRSDPAESAVYQNVSLSSIQNSSIGQQAAAAIAARQNNIVPTLADMRADITNAAQQAGKTFSPFPNVLDQYANYTYHIRWSLANDIVSSSIRSAAEFENAGKIVIAESGATVGFNISDLEIDNICPVGPQTQAMGHTGWKMTIREPYGLSLVDRLYAASQIMGVHNHLTSPSFLEVWFTGYGEDGHLATTDMKKTIYRLFRVNVTKMLAETTSSGTTYHLEGLFDGTYANSDTVAIATASSLNIGPASTIGEFFSKLENALNSQQRNLDYDFTQRNIYKFSVPVEMAGWKFSRNPVTSQRQSGLDVRSGRGTSNPTITIARGMDVSTILYFVLGMTDEGRRYVAGEERASGSRRAARQAGASIQNNGMANAFSIHSRVELVGFDHITSDYVRRITYTFVKYETNRAMIDQSNVRNVTNSPAMQTNRLQSQLTSERFSKAYEYIYTGRNLDILRFDIKLEFFWQSMIPTQLGENTYTNYSVGPQQDSNGVATSVLSQYRAARAHAIRAQTQLENATAVLNNRGSTPQERLAATQDKANATRELNQARLDLTNLGNNDARNFQVTWDNSSSGQHALQNIQVTNPALLQDRNVAQSLVAASQWSQMTQTRRSAYLEDVKTTAFVPTPLPVSFRTGAPPMAQRTTMSGEASPDRAGTQQGPENMPRSRGLVASVLNDMTTAPYFVSIDLDIRGDPFWLGLGNIAENQYIENHTTPQGQDAAWFYSGETGFLLLFRTGEAPSEDSGLMEFKNTSVAFAGLYGATNIKSTFRDGKFTQNIKAVRDPLISQGLPTTAELEKLTTQAHAAVATGGPI
jgi:hypothetical protein